MVNGKMIERGEEKTVKKWRREDKVTKERSIDFDKN